MFKNKLVLHSKLIQSQEFNMCVWPILTFIALEYLLSNTSTVLTSVQHVFSECSIHIVYWYTSQTWVYVLLKSLIFMFVLILGIEHVM